MTLLELIQASCNEMGITSPSAVVSATDQQTIQLLALANMCGQQLASDYQWNHLTKVKTFTLETSSQSGTTTSGSASVTGLSDTSDFAADTWEVSGTGIPTNTTISSVDSGTSVTLSQNATESGTNTLTFTKTIYDLPDDWNHQINRTHWDRTNFWELVGPKSAQEWEWLKGGIVSTGPRVRYRILGNKFQIWPLQVSSSTIAYEYITEDWVIASGNSDPTKTEFDADTDTCIFRDRLMINGIKLKFFEIKGFDTTTLYRDYMMEKEKAMAQDKGAPTLSLNPQTSNVLISPANVPDGNVYGE